MAVLMVALPAGGDTPSTQRSQSVAGKPPPFGGDDYLDQAFSVQQTTAEVRKAKVQFVLPDVGIRANVLVCFAAVDQEEYFGSEFAQKMCSEVAPIPLPPEYRNSRLLPDGLQSITTGRADTYIVNFHGRNAPNTYGAFPPTKVQSLVFGSIPVSATVHLEQTVTNGYVDPLSAVYANVVGVNNAGSLAYPGFGPIPPPPAGDSVADWDLTFRNTIDGTLRLRLSDVAVDGRPVDIGARCTTVSPVRLTVREPLGYALSGAANPQVRGLPGGFYPAQGQDGKHPGYFDGTANIPAFTGCGSATEDLDPLLTALISSPVNRVTGFLPTSTLIQTFCDSALADSSCNRAVSAGQRRMQAVAVAIANHKSPAEIRKLQAQLKPSDYVMPKVKPNGES